MAQYGGFITDLLNAYLTGKTVKALLVASTYAQDVDAHNFVSDISTSEIATTGYTAGGVTLTSVAVTYDTDTDQARLTCADLAFGTFTDGLTSIGGPVFYIDSGDPTTSRLICADMSGSPFDVAAGDSCTYSLSTDGSGLFYLQVIPDVVS